MQIVDNRRLVINIAITYGKSLYVILCGFLLSRWTIKALGTTEYGLYGFVGGLTAFVTFFNEVLSSSISRFYAYAVGAVEGGSVDRSLGIAQCQMWFNSAFIIHTFVPLLLIVIGYPVGSLLIRRWFDVPTEMVGDTIIVFGFVCLSCFVSMVNVPFSAMFVAKQRLAELMLYSLITTTLNLIFVSYMVFHPGEWLVRYAFAVSVFSVVPQIIICVRAICVFEECRFNFKYMRDLSRFPTLVKFSAWQFFGNLGYLVKGQGMSIVVNKFFGPIYNASMNLSSVIGTHADGLAVAVNSAFSPVITNLAGAGKRELLIENALRMCKMMGFVSVIIILPLEICMKEVLGLWLVKQPPLLCEITRIVLATVVIRELGRGIATAVTAVGKIACYYFWLGLLNVLSVPLACLILCMGWGSFTSVFWTLLGVQGVCLFVSVMLSARVTEISFGKWANNVFLPVVGVATISLLLAYLIGAWIADFEWIRSCSMATIACVLYVFLGWFIILEKKERVFIIKKITSLMRRGALKQ